MLVSDWCIACFRHAFLRHAPRRYALMLAPAEALRLGQKYMERRGVITDTMIARHLHGVISLAVPAAVDGRAHLLPLDIDAGGSDAIHALIAEAARQKLWVFGQYCMRQALAEADQRGYVWLPFDALTDAHRLQALGAQLIAASSRPGWKIEARAFHAVTRLPLARHTYTERFGDLLLADRQIAIDQDYSGALAALHHAYRENRSTALHELVPPPQPRPKPAMERHGAGITITQYNQAHDIADLLRFYGARPTRRRGLYFCPFHADEHASLSVYTHRGHHYCRCFSAHSDCPLAEHSHNDAFNVHCIPPSRRAVTPHQRNPFASPAHPLLSYHDDQQLRPSRPLELSRPYCILVPRHPRLCHWWQPVLVDRLTPSTMLCIRGARAGRLILPLVL